MFSTVDLFSQRQRGLRGLRDRAAGRARAPCSCCPRCCAAACRRARAACRPRVAKVRAALAAGARRPARLPLAQARRRGDRRCSSARGPSSGCPATCCSSRSGSTTAPASAPPRRCSSRSTSPRCCPITPSNLGVFQAACVAVLAGAYGVGKADALAYGIILQAVEVATAVVMGAPALVKEGLSWRDVRLRAMHASPVQLDPLPASPARSAGTPAAAERLAGISRRAAKPLAVPEAWVYLLRCADGSLYTGWTIDLDARLRRHGAGTGERLHAQPPAGRARPGAADGRPHAPRGARRRGSRRSIGAPSSR